MKSIIDQLKEFEEKSQDPKNFIKPKNDVLTIDLAQEKEEKDNASES